MNSSNEKSRFFSTSPSTSNFQVARSIGGAPCASSTGHFLVRVCPGGIRFSRRVSGLMMISGSSICSGWRGSLVWYFGSLIRLLRKLIKAERLDVRKNLSHSSYHDFSFREDIRAILQKLLSGLDGDAASLRLI